MGVGVNIPLRVECGGQAVNTSSLELVRARMRELHGKHDADSVREWAYLRQLKARMKARE